MMQRFGISGTMRTTVCPSIRRPNCRVASWSNYSPSAPGKNRQPGPDDCTDALQREILQDHGEKASRMEEIFQAEKDADYPQVAKLCRIIDAATQTVLVEPGLIQRLENPDRSQWPDWREMMLGSVQLWANRLDAGKLPVKPLGHDGELWAGLENMTRSSATWPASYLYCRRARKALSLCN